MKGWTSRGIAYTVPACWVRDHTAGVKSFGHAEFGEQVEVEGVQKPSGAYPASLERWSTATSEALPPAADMASLV